MTESEIIALCCRQPTEAEMRFWRYVEAKAWEPGVNLEEFFKEAQIQAAQED
jgi:hypothetical protein